jgi:hypothetical protein
MTIFQDSAFCRRRDTTRKRLIRDALDKDYSERAVLIDELRWKAFSVQLENKPNLPQEISRSFQNSFARTLREQNFNHFFFSRPTRWRNYGKIPSSR